MSKPDLQAIPRSACTLRAEFAHLGDNGDNAKTAPVKLLARSSQPIEHHWWGNVAHDLNGFNLNGKKRLPIDFDHDTGEAIGYLNKFEVEEDGLYASGAIVSTQEGDRASKILSQMRAGIPYEASINFGGDGIEVERVPEGKTAMVNGYELAGESVIVRKYPLRGVAVCLYGYDAQTSTNLLSDSGTVAAVVLNNEEEGDMPETNELSAEADAVDVPETAAEEVAPTETEVEETTELSQAVEAEPAEAVEAVEAVEVEAEEEEDTTFSASEFARMVTDFGSEVAAQVVTNGGKYADALQLAYEAEKAENAKLRERVSELSANPRTASTAVSFADGEAAKNKRVKLADGLQAKFDQLRGTK